MRLRITTETHDITFSYREAILRILLPAERELSYNRPKLGTNKFDGESVTYDGVGSEKKWERTESYGPKFVENITQAVARDILANSMRLLSDHKIVGHVHDELIIECPMEESVEDVCLTMGSVPKWMHRIPPRADGYETMYYKKD